MDQGNTSIKLKATTPIPLNIEFSCKNGEIFVIVGPSGSGKTTILRCIAGLYAANTGKIICRGKTWFDSENNIHASIQDRAAGFVYQDYALFPHLTVRENISLPIKEKKKSIRDQRTDEYIQLVHLNGLDDRLPYQLSGGQQQRVAVARAMARDPDILLLDEPFSSVDQQTRRFLVRELIQLKHQLNIPIIHVTHDLNEARRIADQLCIIQDG
ncbi:MAG: ATP-binding cassette domain-containing protein, partial [Gammaproteobacteria bacterium]|nr:ATP-binding cassette domain-containing protein [Gammaproteobacteria bacterium]